MDSYCYLNGEILPEKDATVSVNDIGLLRGFGIYEGLITHNRKPFMFADHMARFHRSASKMSLTIPATDAAIEAAIRDLTDRNVPAGSEALIRIILTGGTTSGVIDYNPDTPTMFILVTTFVPLEEQYLQNGCKVITREYHRDLAEIKSINYINTVLMQKDRKAAGALELVYTSGGYLLEAGGSNVCIVKNGVIITPKDEIVLGITRKAVLDLAKGVFPIEERPVTVEEMLSADEVFITGSFKEVVPVVQIDDKTVAGGTPGPITKNIIALFHDFTRDY